MSVGYSDPFETTDARAFYITANMVADHLRARINIDVRPEWRTSECMRSGKPSRVVLSWDDFLALADPHLA